MLRVKSGSVRESNLNFVLANISIKSEPSLPSASPGGKSGNYHPGHGISVSEASCNICPV